MGFTCPNRGCFPSKRLIGFTEAARHLREADQHFIDTRIRKIDPTQAFRSVNGYVGEEDGRNEGRLQQAGVDLIRGRPHLLDTRDWPSVIVRSNLIAL